MFILFATTLCSPQQEMSCWSATLARYKLTWAWTIALSYVGSLHHAAVCILENCRWKYELTASKRAALHEFRGTLGQWSDILTT